MLLTSPAPDALTKSRHTYFIQNLARLVGADLFAARPLRFLDGQIRPKSYEQNGCRVALSHPNPHTLTLEYIQCEPSVRGGGRASQHLQQLCKLADTWRVCLRLLPVAHESGSMSDQALTEWYQRYGFTETDGKYLVRIP